MPRYFAYCTLLDSEEMRRFCPNARPTLVARLGGYRVAFAHYGVDQPGGGCNLEVAPGHQIYGMVYDLSDEEYDELDRISGVDRGYYERVEFTVYGDDDELSATTYVMPHPGGPFQPTSAYVRPILAGAAALHLPADYQAELAETVRAATGT
ncbi:MAG: gamma-glutamylcyclotransferase family protein [Nitrolancea sp.]